MEGWVGQPGYLSRSDWKARECVLGIDERSFGAGGMVMMTGGEFRCVE